MTIKDFTAGQTAYIIGDGRRLSYSGAYAEVKVVKVGRKYITASSAGGNREMRFAPRHEHEPYLVEDTEYGAPRLLFSTVEAVEQYVEANELRQYVCKAVTWSTVDKLSLEQLREIKKILER